MRIDKYKYLRSMDILDYWIRALYRRAEGPCTPRQAYDWTQLAGELQEAKELLEEAAGL